VIGGLTKMRSNLENLLRVGLEIVCPEQGRAAMEFLNRGRSLRKATAGELAHALKDAAGTHRGPARVLVEDLRGRRSILFRVIEARNKAAHERVVPVVLGLFGRRRAEGVLAPSAGGAPVTALRSDYR
jgi:hypothetical protein